MCWFYTLLEDSGVLFTILVQYSKVGNYFSLLGRRAVCWISKYVNKIEYGEDLLPLWLLRSYTKMSIMMSCVLETIQCIQWKLPPRIERRQVEDWEMVHYLGLYKQGLVHKVHITTLLEFLLIKSLLNNFPDPVVEANTSQCVHNL